MPRAYIRLDPAFDERKHAYPDGAYAALIGTFCLAELQPERGRFRSAEYLARLLGRRGRFVKYLIEMGDVVELSDGRAYVEGWDEWQEGDVTVKERMALLRERRGQPTRSAGARRTANWRLRNEIFDRDNYTCRYCGVSDYPRDWLVLEHVIPDGPTDIDNLVTACRPCNKKKGGRSPEQAGMMLRDASRDTSQGTDSVTASPVLTSDSHSVSDSHSAGLGDDPADVYWQLTGKYPAGKALSWIDSLGAEFGSPATSRAIAGAFTADRNTTDLLSRAQNLLRADARKLSLRDREAEAARLAEKRAQPRKVEPWREEYRRMVEARYGQDDAA
jgi:5-methylcytosine-specific restriction endonuclease McrA